MRVVVDEVTLTNENGGFVVVYDADSFGDISRPDNRVGISNQLPAGTSDNIQIDLQFGEAVANERLTAVLVNDSNANGRYDPGVDMGAVDSEGNIVSDSANVDFATDLFPGDLPDDGENTTTTTPEETTETETPTETTEDGDDGGIFGAESTEADESETTTTTTAETSNDDDSADGDDSESADLGAVDQAARSVYVQTSPQ